jgi:hypothetical protein
MSEAFSEDQISKVFDSFDENMKIYACRYQKLSEKFIRDNIEKIPMHHIATQELSLGFIKEFSDKLNWRLMSSSFNLTKDFVKEHYSKIVWECVQHNRNLSEDFILQFSDQIGWEGISLYQKISKEFILNNSNKICWELIVYNKNVSKETLKDVMPVEMKRLCIRITEILNN